ncbi:MAG: FtsX-like permease family protein [Candidatus Abyssobacteria bacterium SURF_17]|uniref:FtsX-like permease family protein n=1 Tax=Candidatus Abyssobacteria bacterium SURF_17 TaxID=2093361 RepID=A0A419EZZ6_9BACT|nr:MAG: FtsX-like permease family protein [Candidatus Abyssubacteria bacterium SURF_17]
MFLVETIAQAWQSIRSHKLRTGLTMFGVIWGIASFIILVGLGKSTLKLFSREFEKVGKRMLVMWAGQSSSGLSGIKGGRQIRFTIDDVEAIKAHCPHVELVSPQIYTGYQETKYENEVLSSETFGLDVNSGVIRNLDVAKGRFINADDIALNRRVCVLGANVKEKLFGERESVGEFIRMSGIRFQVVGVLQHKGDQLSRVSGSIDDDQISIPYTTAQALFTGSKYFGMIYLQPRSLFDDKTVREEVRQTLALRHSFEPDDADALHFFGIAEMIGRVKGVAMGMEIFFGAASIITLLIGGIGVMNIMFVSINERVREIGIMKAVGAKSRHVFLQFIVESVFVTFLAGLIGVLIGCSICLLIGLFNLPRFVAAPVIDPFVMLIAFLTITLVGILSGILPALRASRMQVVEALRYY